ncbi:hypothetical protein B0E43_14550 [Algoriphagus sp. A40]|nr:hypothetical protein B0E43_14550 [Algoriphagus sp. A40]
MQPDFSQVFYSNYWQLLVYGFRIRNRIFQKPFFHIHQRPVFTKKSLNIVSETFTQLNSISYEISN